MDEVTYSTAVLLPKYRINMTVPRLKEDSMEIKSEA